MLRLIAPALLAAGLGLLPAHESQAAGDLARGQYLATIMDCGGCHTGGVLMGRPDPARYLAGSEVGFQIPGLGVFYPPNLTADEATGLGAWSEADILLALREGIRPDGRELAPAMPWRSYAAISEEDGQALAAYLKSLPAVAFKAPGPFGPEEKPSAPYLTMAMPR